MEINYTDRWNELCYLLSENIARNMSEEAFEKVVLQALRVLEWKGYQGDIEVRPAYQLGASNRITPDLIVKGDDKRKLFVIEIKQPDILLNSRFQQQLFSYMRQLKLEFGILIGQAIQVFYDGELIQQEDPVLLDTIHFERDNPQGILLTKLFSKESFSLDSLRKYASQAIEKINRAENYSLLLKQITSENYKPRILNLIKQDLIGGNDSEVVDSVLNNIEVRIINRSEFSATVLNIVERPVITRVDHSLSGSLPIDLIPENEEEFKRGLLENRFAYITTVYNDGSYKTKIWRIYRFQQSSTVIGNLRSRQEFRNGEWQKLGIVKVMVTLDKYSVPD